MWDYLVRHRVSGDISQEIAPDVTQMEAAQIGAAPQIDMSQIQGTVSEASQAQAATEELDERATVQYQLGELMGSIEEGKPFPRGPRQMHEKLPVLCKLGV